jgi:multiple sugar transport system permease protein
LVIYYFRGFFGTDWGALMASAMIAVLPILVVFSFLGKLMVSGLTQGAVKG